MATIEIYTKAFCPYCTRAKRLLDGKDVSYTEHDITMGGPRRAEMIERAQGRTTVPQVFIDGQHIGGSDDLAALDREGGLDSLLAK
ncbi:glutaredoxin 3 [Sphingomonas sp. S1-29]|uniref:glutaredoxin 3 n=1 Tax=Sphingomonas sp. S1-29 TaxID=2991074 RepID=UPI00223FC2AC|nr:glutaredoxin 3 [Sphingomonas sp. S1-29]UZK71022.1 glutaredoxin 3 [Sphingomonas sp. S1-29]